ncbi:MAG: hypothetical protein R3B72_38185 [Polyangiaceae bacterium]
MRLGVSATALLVVVPWLHAGCHTTPSEPMTTPTARVPQTPSGSTASAAPGDPPPNAAPTAADWPEDPTAAWPKGCLIEAAGVNPRWPWLAVGCTNAEAEQGAVLVFDGDRRRLRTASTRHGYVGWGENRHLLRWHPDGDRLAVNVDTNGIGLLRRAQWVSASYPDQTRDSGVSYVWVGDQIFTDTGALFALDDGEDHFDDAPISPISLGKIELNAATGAVVGRTDDQGYLRGIGAFDPNTRTVRYHNRLQDLKAGHAAWATDGRGYAQIEFGPPDMLHILDGDDGQARWSVRPSLPQVGWMWWGRDRLLAVHSRNGRGPSARNVLDIVVGGRITKTIDLSPHQLRKPMGSSFEDMSQLAWSPDDKTLAVVLDDRKVRLFDVTQGTALTTFDAPAPAIPQGLPDHYRLDHHKRPREEPGGIIWLSNERLARCAPHFVSLWTTQGEKLGEWIVPD